MTRRSPVRAGRPPGATGPTRRPGRRSAQEARDFSAAFLVAVVLVAGVFPEVAFLAAVLVAGALFAGGFLAAVFLAAVFLAAAPSPPPSSSAEAGSPPSRAFLALSTLRCKAARRSTTCPDSAATSSSSA